MSPKSLFLALGAASLASGQHVIPPSCSASLSCTSMINAAIAACGVSACAIELEAGIYILEGVEYGPRITVSGARGLSITGAGDATVLLSNISNVFSVLSSENVLFSSFAVDMERVPFTFGQVSSTNATASTVDFDATSTYRVELDRHPWLNRAQGVISFDVAKQRYGKGTDIYALGDPIAITYPTPSGASAQLLINTSLPLDEWVVIRHQTYGYNAFDVVESSAIQITNVTLWAVAGMGVYTDQCTDIVLDGLRVEKKENRPMSITADGVHFSNSRGGDITLRNCLFEGQGDDGLNAPTLFQYILAIAGDRLSFQVGGRGTSGAAVPFLKAGDTAQFFSRESLLPLGPPALVTSIGSNNTVILATPAPPNATVYSLINNAAEYASTLTVTDCTFRNNRARGALLKSSNVYAARNVFDGCTASAAKTETDGCYWFEGHPVSNWSFVDNKISEVNFWGGLPDIVIDNAVPVFKNGVPTTQCIPFSGAAPGAAVQRQLNISGNSIVQISGESPIGVYSTDGLELRGNIIVRENGVAVPPFDFQGYGVVNAVVVGNECDGRACKTSGLGARAPQFLGSVTAIPSPEQLEWMDYEIGAMITFNLQTICVPCNSPNATKQKCQAFGCIPSLSALHEWTLENLSTDDWLDVALSLKAKYSVLVADHMSGFTLWPTKVHNYSIQATQYKGGDVVANFRASAAAREIAPGVFYSTHYNWVLGMNNYEVGWPRVYGGPALTQAQYEDAALAQLQELADYGPWKELWFDGGVNVNATPRLPSFVRATFPSSMCHSCSPFTEASAGSGTGRGIRWMGNEEGAMPLPSWAAADRDGSPPGSPTGEIFDPPSCDTVLEEHYWFYQVGDIAKLRSTCALVNVYLTSVGRASNFILNIAPDSSGGVQPAEVTAYASLGDAIDCLWHAPIYNWTSVPVDLATGIASLPLTAQSCASGHSACSLSFVVQEELASSGQRIGAFAVEAFVDGAWISAVASGMPTAALTGVGHKRILGLEIAAGASYDALRVRVTTAYSANGDVTAPITLRAAALFNRNSTAQCLPAGCELVAW